MKRLKWIGLVVMLIAMCTCAHSASAAPVISVDPGSIEVTEGETFTVNIMVDPAGSEILGAEYKLYFDNTLLNAIDLTQETFLSQDGVSAMKIRGMINNTLGKIEYGEFRRNVDYGVNTSGVLATITFNATSSGVCDLTLDDVILSDPEPVEIPDVVILSGTCNIKAVEQTPPTPTPTETEPTMSARMPSKVETTETEDQITPDTPAPPSPESSQTALPSTPPTTLTQQPDETAEQSGFASAFVSTVLLVVSYLILRKSD